LDVSDYTISVKRVDTIAAVLEFVIGDCHWFRANLASECFFLFLILVMVLLNSFGILLKKRILN